MSTSSDAGVLYLRELSDRNRRIKMSGISLSTYNYRVPPIDPAQSKALAFTKWADRTPEDQAAAIKSKADMAAADACWAVVDRKSM